MKNSFEPPNQHALWKEVAARSNDTIAKIDLATAGSDQREITTVFTATKQETTQNPDHSRENRVDVNDGTAGSKVAQPLGAATAAAGASETLDATDALTPVPAAEATSAPIASPEASASSQKVARLALVTAPRPHCGQSPQAPSHNISPASKSPYNLLSQLEVVLSQHGVAYVAMCDAGNAYAVPVGSKRLNSIIRKISLERGEHLRNTGLSEANELLAAHAETSGKPAYIWQRVAPFEDGIEIDIGDNAHTRIRVTPGKVETITEGSETLFARSAVTLPLVVPAEKGDVQLLYAHLNLPPVERLLLIAWLTYTLAHPKVDSSKYLILVIQGDQGSGKTLLCKNVILPLIDAHRLGVQVFPNTEQDLCIASQQVHVLCFDNMRNFNQRLADILCVMATGGTVSSRALYTNADLHINHIHGPAILNGIHSFITQPDLAQRSLPLRTLAITEQNRKFEAAMMASLERDLPAIFRGLLDLIAAVFEQLPDIEITNPERMIDFVGWLAAMEKVDGAPSGAYQSAYSDTLRQAQLDSLLENQLAATVFSFATEKMQQSKWSGTPAELLEELNCLVPTGTQYSKQWPDNPIALSKRLNGLKSSLHSQGIELEFSRGKHRTITIRVTETPN